LDATFARHQPVTAMVDTIRSLSLGDAGKAVLPQSTATRRDLAAVVRGHRRRGRPTGHPPLHEELMT
jgi:hypothetical protein